jgi:hypothetical protein
VDVCESACALVLSLTIATASVHLAKCIGVEVLHSNGSATIVLQNLVAGALGTTAVHVRSARGLFECCGIFTDIQPPNIVKGTCTQAVNTFAVVWTNNNVRKGSSSCKNEDSISVATFGLVVAGANYDTSVYV